jgi:hypothetical protein
MTCTILRPENPKTEIRNKSKIRMPEIGFSSRFSGLLKS